MSLKDRLFEEFRLAKLDKNRSNEAYDYYSNIEDFLIAAGYDGDRNRFIEAYCRWSRKHYPETTEITPRIID